MSPQVIPLQKAGPGNLRRERSKLVEAIWLLVELCLVTNPLQISSRLRVAALTAFGARIGRGVIFRPGTRVKYPWNLTVGDHCWIGEEVWIHNQGKLVIENDVVVSQGTFITTGSHDTRKTMDLIIDEVRICQGAWITSKCIVLKGVTVGMNTIVTPGSVVTRSLPAQSVFGGNPAVFIKARVQHE